MNRQDLANEIEKQIEEAAQMGEPPSFALDRHDADALVRILRTGSAGFQMPAAPRAEVGDKEEVQQLRAFAKRIFDMVEWPECLGEVDGFNFQEAACDAGLLRPEVRHEPCGDGDEKPCQCVEYHGSTSSIWQSGVTCFRKAPYLVEETISPQFSPIKDG